MEGTETKDECLHRELLEELGWAIEINQYIGNAMRYFYAEKEDTYYLNDGFFYIANMVQKRTGNCEEDHVLRWMSPLHAIEYLLHDHQKWAVEQALLLRNKKDLLLYERDPFTVSLPFQIESWLFDSTFFTTYRPTKIISPPTSCIILICSLLLLPQNNCEQRYKIHIYHYFR